MSERIMPSLPIGTGVTVHSHGDGAILAVTVCGTWDAPLRHETVTLLRKCFAAHPDALIIDLTALHDADTQSLSVWLHARLRGAHMRPPVPVALCVAPELSHTDHLQRRIQHRFPPLYAKARQAQVALHSRILTTDRQVLHLTADPQAPGLARELVADACLAWYLGQLLFAGRLVISELVSNAVRHARTDIAVAVSRRGTGIHLVVCDNDRRLPPPPRSPAPQHLAEHGRGLQIVHATAARWGAIPTFDGKMVWATIRPPRAKPTSTPR